MNTGTIFYYKYLFIGITAMIAFCFIFAYICEFYLGYNYGIAFIYGSSISFFAGLPFFVLFMKDQKKLGEKEEQSDHDSLDQNNKIGNTIIANCYICDTIAEDSCYHCDKPVCKDHLTTLQTLSYCTHCIDRDEIFKKKISSLVRIFMILAIFSFIIILFLSFT